MFISSPTRCSLLAGSAFGNAIGATRLASAALAETLVGAKASGIQPFTTHFPASDLVDLHRRIAATSWPERETVGRYPSRQRKVHGSFGNRAAFRAEGDRALATGAGGQVRIMLLASFGEVRILQASTQIDPSQQRKTSMPTMLEEAAIRGPMIFLRYWTRQILVSFRRHRRIPENLAGEA